MSEKKKKIKKKNRKLLVDVSIITFIMFLISMTVISITSVNGVFSLYYDSKVGDLKRNVNSIKTVSFSSDSSIWLLDYLRNNVDDYQWYANAELIARSKNIESFYFSKLIEDENADPYDVLNSLSPEEQEAVAYYLLRQLNENIVFQVLNEDYDNIYIVDLTKEHYGHSYLFDFLDSDVPVSELIKKDTVKNLPTAAGNDEIFGKSEFEADHEDDGSVIISCFTPIYHKGKLKAVLIIRYDCDDIVELQKNNVMNMIITGIISLLLTNFLLVMFIYNKATKPLGSVKKAMIAYKTGKDSKKAISKMKQIKVRNEVGVLADSFSDMTEELENYMTENLRLTKDKERVAAELELAAKIQLDMLPRQFPQQNVFDLFASMTPAKEVGGDFYDFFQTDEDHLCMVIADVSGKGMPAALFMMKSKIIIKEIAQSGDTPAVILKRANEALCENNTNMMFVTVWLGILEISTGKLTAANAGHEYPVLKGPDGEFKILKDKHGVALGLVKNKVYTEYELTLQKGSSLFVYTDGVAEATNSEDKMFSTDRLLGVMNKAPDAEPEKHISDVRQAIDTFVGDAVQFDDITMLCINIK